MSMQVHYMALESERRLLPMQAERGWQIEQAESAIARQAPVVGPRVRSLSTTVLDWLDQALQTIVATTRSAGAPSA